MKEIENGYRSVRKKIHIGFVEEKYFLKFWLILYEFIWEKNRKIN